MKRILLVDDDQNVREVLQKSLEVGGFNVVPAANGAEAAVRMGESPIDLVITDIIMPEVEGIEMIFWLRREYGRIPIIAMSGGGKMDSASCLTLAKAAGANLALIKPFPLLELTAAARHFTGAGVNIAN